MKAILLCAGYATRLYPLTKETPKHLLEIGGKPIIERALSHIERIAEVDSIHVITNDKFFFRFLEWAAEYEKKNPKAKKVSILNDGTDSNETRLGALGDIMFTIEKKAIKDDILLIAADNLFEFDLSAMHEAFRKRERTLLALYDVKETFLAREYGVVEVDSEGKLVHFQEKPKEPKSTLISTGIYMIPRRDIAFLRVYINSGYSTDRLGSFFEWLHTKEEVYCHVTQDTWYDIGTIDQLEEAKRHYEKAGTSIPHQGGLP